ncbi:hypothetical protein ES319_D10G120500v1 [Gossypium barbadense]|uniref:Uncharacterized protein n=2 Tax=Gossypium TaxID=3633 RepID=A0A5J5PQH9_GOSBA|nr:hypothetical protein ES319_D10G120500v1 [Gossypium barbadense]TYG49870.1 hypothetical protein ES288_D10G128700v1 [Gossypium darwinii]
MGLKGFQPSFSAAVSPSHLHHGSTACGGRSCATQGFLAPLLAFSGPNILTLEKWKENNKKGSPLVPLYSVPAKEKRSPTPRP